jgi:hypothetical protein
MRRILGTITATLAIVAISGMWLSPPENIPLGDGVDQATSSAGRGTTVELTDFIVDA